MLRMLEVSFPGLKFQKYPQFINGIFATHVQVVSLAHVLIAVTLAKLVSEG